MKRTNVTRRGAWLCAPLAMALGWTAFAAKPQDDFRARLPQDEVIYFVLPDRFENGDAGNDRGGLDGERLRTGFDPAHKGFYHGGDLVGLTKRLDYIAGLGATALWLGPIYKNKPVQGRSGHESAGYHGYWITDFTDVDPHFGTRAELKALVDAAHARGIKVYLDIITNHTADVIKYRDCDADPCRLPLARRVSVFGARRRQGRAHQRGVRRRPRVGADGGELRQAHPRRLCVPAVRAGYRAGHQGAGVAQRSAAVPQPRRLDVQGRELALRRFLRPRRPVHREPARGAGLHRHLRPVDRRLRHRRLPHRHRTPRQPGVLAGVRAGDAGAREGARHPQLPHLRRGVRSRSRHARALHPRRPLPGGARLRVPVRGPRCHRRQRRYRPTRAAVHARRQLRGRRRGGAAAADLPRQPRHGSLRAFRAQGASRHRAMPSC